MKKIYWWEKKRTWKRVEAEKEGGGRKGQKERGRGWPRTCGEERGEKKREKERVWVAKRSFL